MQSDNSPMVWDVGLALPLLISDSTYIYIYGNSPIGMVDAQGNAYYYLRDGLGSVTGIADSSGTLTATYSYDAYGNLRSSTGTISNAFRYTGEWYDSETGLYYLRARYYDPSVGRFVTRDPFPGDLSLPYSLNPYLYVANDPVLLSDPSGLTWPENWKLFWDWVLERGGKNDTNRYYGPDEPATEEMMKTEGAEKMRREYAAGGCESGSGSYGTFAAYWETVRKPWNGTQFQVGGFSYRFTANGNGTVTYSIHNELTKESFFYHMYDIPLAGGALRVLAPYFQNKPERGGLFPFMGNMTQDFEWTEPNP